MRISCQFLKKHYAPPSGGIKPSAVRDLGVTPVIVGFRVNLYGEFLVIAQHPEVSTVPPRQWFLAAEAYRRGLLSEGQIARMLRVDRIEAKSDV